jgi:hypothetical protein
MRVVLLRVFTDWKEYGKTWSAAWNYDLRRRLYYKHLRTDDESSGREVVVVLIDGISSCR